MLPLAQLPVEQLFQFLSGEIHGGGLADERIDNWFQPAPGFFPAEYSTFTDDEDATAGPRFNESIASEVRVGVRDGVGIEDKLFSQYSHTGKLLTEAESSCGDRESHLIGNLLVDRRTRAGADGDRQCHCTTLLVQLEHDVKLLKRYGA